VRRFKVAANGQSLAGGEVFATCPLACTTVSIDTAGNLWLSAADGVHCHAPTARCSARSACETVSNVCFGGAS
jgi:gluconolactonase